MTQCIAELNNEQCQREGDHGRNLCTMHAKQKSRHGQITNIRPTMRRERMAMPAPRRFATNIKAGGHDLQCWEWTGAKDRDGYGRFADQGKSNRAHRWTWKHLVDPNLDNNTHLDHICMNVSCVRPSHLQPVSRTEHHEVSRRQRKLLEQAKDSVMVGGNLKPRTTQELTYAIRHNLPSTMHGARLASVGQ